jgi:hypothetical protein
MVPGLIIQGLILDGECTVWLTHLLKFNFFMEVCAQIVVEWIVWCGSEENQEIVSLQMVEQEKSPKVK